MIIKQSLNQVSKVPTTLSRCLALSKVLNTLSRSLALSKVLSTLQGA